MLLHQVWHIFSEYAVCWSFAAERWLYIGFAYFSQLKPEVIISLSNALIKINTLSLWS